MHMLEIPKMNSTGCTTGKTKRNKKTNKQTKKQTKTTHTRLKGHWSEAT